MTLLIILLILIVALAITSYNKLQKLAQSVRRQASNIQVSISKKLSLINQLIDVVKNYQEAEQLVQLKVSQDNTAVSLMNSYQQSGTTLASIQGLAQRFPDLKANEQYHRLIDNIEKCENDIQSQRIIYNNCVEQYNQARLKIPTIFVARFMGFSEAPYLQFDISGANDVTSLKEFKTDDGERLQQFLSNAGSSIKGATKTIANHAGQAGKLIADKVKEKTATRYFYMTPGGVPKGPVGKEEIMALKADGQVGDDTLITIAGSEEWKAISVLASETSNFNSDNSQ